MKWSPFLISDHWKTQVFQVALIWTLLSGIIFLKTSVLGPLAELGMISINDEVISWLFSLVFLPIVVYAVAKRSMPYYWPVSILINLLLAVLASVLWDWLFVKSTPIEAINPGFQTADGISWSGGQSMFLESVAFDMFSSVLLISGIAYAISAIQVLRRKELNESNLKALLAQSKITQLKSQVHPHFMFNTLNTVAGLMERDVEKAQEVLEDLSYLLRTSLQQSDRQEVPLREELEFLNRYIEIEKIRFKGKVKFLVLVDEACEEAAIPHMILQPIIENSLKHGLQESGEKGVVQFSASKEEGTLRLVIEDDGLGFKSPFVKGIGTGILEERLQAIYRDDAHLEITHNQPRGTRVIISVPFKTFESTDYHFSE